MRSVLGLSLNAKHGRCSVSRGRVPDHLQDTTKVVLSEVLNLCSYRAL